MDSLIAVCRARRLPGFARIVGGLLVACVLLPVSARAEEPPAEPRWSGNANLFLGGKFLDRDEWDPVDRQLEAGLLLDARHRVLPFNIALDLLYSRKEKDVDVEVMGLGTTGMEVTGETMEADLGVRKIWEPNADVRPFLGGGAAFIRAEIEASGLGRSVSDDDSAIGVWLDAGVYVTLYGRWNLGVEGRWSWAKADFMGIENVDVGGRHLGALLGVHF